MSTSKEHEEQTRRDALIMWATVRKMKPEDRRYFIRHARIVAFLARWDRLCSIYIRFEYWRKVGRYVARSN